MLTEYLPLEMININNIVYYKRQVNEDIAKPRLYRQYEKICLLTPDRKSYHKYCAFNKFSIETYPFSPEMDCWQIDPTILPQSDVWKCSFDPTSKLFCPLEANRINESRPKDCDLYKTLDNYEIGFLVYINRDQSQEPVQNQVQVHVYGRTTDVLPRSYIYEIDQDGFDQTILFTKKIITYYPLEVFIGSSSYNGMTSLSGAHGDQWTGNSFLLRIGHQDEFKYVHIGTEIFEFVADEKITTYESTVGNNLIPYPYAESQNYCWDMSSKRKTPLDHHPNRKTNGEIYDEINAMYEDMDYTIVANSYQHRYEADPVEIRHLIKYQKSKMDDLQNTCIDNSLCFDTDQIMK